MPNIQVDSFGVVSRSLPQAATDTLAQEMRIGRYREPYALSLIRKQHLLADEGSYRVANNNNQTGITDNAGTAFSATLATVLVYNSDSPGNAGAKRIYLDFININAVTANTAASTAGSIQGAVYIDAGNRYTSGGTNLTANIINPNGDLANSSIAQVYCGALTVAAATGAVRAVNPFMAIRLAASGTAFNVAGENMYFNFGPVEGNQGTITIANANNINVPLPPLIIGPQQCVLLYLWYAAGTTNAAGTIAPTVAWWER